jgi:hypothetical protein
MFDKFLHSELYSKRIAYIAVIFQTIATLCIGYMLVASFENWLLISTTLVWFLVADSAFVCLHLTYRALYRGKRITLSPLLKRVLIVHTVSSSCALLLTFYICFVDSFVDKIIYTSLVVWGISLLSGVWFFSKKYLFHRFLVEKQ